MERVGELTGGLVAVNPNTMYPLLRTLEAEGLVAGEWEHPERRSRRFYRLTDAGARAARRAALRARPAPRRAGGGRRAAARASCWAEPRAAPPHPRLPAASAPRPQPQGVPTSVFVFKAAVVGAGTMGGEIAQVIASAGIPVVLKDVKQEFVDLGLEQGRGGHARAARQPRAQGEDHRGAGRPSRPTEILGRITGTTSYEGFGDVDFVIEAVPERMADQAGRARRARRRPRPATRSSRRTRRRWRSPRWPTRRAAPTRSSAFTSSIPPR